MTILPKQPNWWFDDIIVGRTFEFGAGEITAEDVQLFHDRFAPNLPLKPLDKGIEHLGPRAADSHIYAVFRKMLFDETRSWPILARMSQDNLRFYKACHAGDKLSVMMTFMAVEDRSPSEGVLTANHEVINQEGLLVMSVLTRTLMAKRPKE